MKYSQNTPKTEELKAGAGAGSGIAVDVIIPVYRPDDRFFILLERLTKQTLKPHRIILMNTEESLWDAADGNEKLRNTGAAELCEKIRLLMTVTILLHLGIEISRKVCPDANCY